MARVGGVVLSVRSACALRSLCVRGDPLASLTGADSFILLLAFSRNNNDCVHSFLGPSRSSSSAHHDRRRLPPSMMRGASSVCGEMRGLFCVPCLCFSLAGGENRVFATRDGPSLVPALVGLFSAAVYHATITFVPRSIAMIVVCPSRAPSVVAHGARSKDSSVCGE